MIKSKYTIREQNESIILKKIIDEKRISRANLSTLAHLNKASVSSITKKLLDEQLITEVGIGDSSSVGGRKPILLEFNNHSSLALSIDIGTDYLEGILSFIDGTVIKKMKERKLTITEFNIKDVLLKVVNNLQKDQPETTHGIVGMTLAVHGNVFENKIIYPPNYSLYKADLNNFLEEEFSFPVFLQNEANLAALGEYTFSSKLNNLISLSVHSGIGAGIVQNGILMTGKHGKAGEFGHIILYPDGKQCPCGNNGCLEQYISHKALYNQIEAALNVTEINSDDVKTYYEQNNTIVKDIVLENARLLSMGINSLAVFYDPEVIIINSSVYKKIPNLLTIVKENLVSTFSKEVIITNSNLQTNATLLGGTAQVAQNFLNISNLKFIN